MRRVSIAYFQVLTPRALSDPASCEKALAKARRLARKAGVTLGRPISIVEGGGIVPVPAPEAAKAEGGTPIEPGQTEISASVTVTFAIT